MRLSLNRAEALLAGDKIAVAEAARTLLKPLKHNFVERPWGGTLIRSFKGLYPLPDQPMMSGLGLGESFELSAWDDDAETRAHPSRLRFSDGSEVSLPELLRACGEDLLGSEFVSRYGKAFPLLPKILDIKELLSVQGHPEGNTEVYVIIDAEPGATLRLGFCQDIESEVLVSELRKGREQQEALLGAFAEVIDPAELQGVLSVWMSRRHEPLSALAKNTKIATSEQWQAVGHLLTDLKALYWRVLDSMNVISVQPGQVIYNANPRRILEQTGRTPSSEVHALGNPDNKEILALEIRLPGPTLRAWDNVRFPVRDIDVEAAIAALNWRRTEAGEFIVMPEEVADRPGTFCSVDSQAFRLEHLKPERDFSVFVPQEPPHCLHAIRGRAQLLDSGGSRLGDLEQGESALVPVAVGSYRVESLAPDTEVLKVSLPVNA